MAGVTFQVIRILFFYFLISFFKFYFFIEVQLNYSVVLITAVQQSDSVIHIFFSYSFPLRFITGY